MHVSDDVAPACTHSMRHVSTSLNRLSLSYDVNLLTFNADNDVMLSFNVKHPSIFNYPLLVVSPFYMEIPESYKPLVFKEE
jgi:hypothetical protein